MLSTSSRSIVTPAMSRKNSTRPPFAEMVIPSATFAPLNSISSKPFWPSSVSLSSPGFQTNESSPAPIRATSLPSPPLIRSSPPLPRRPSSVRRSFACSAKEMLVANNRPETLMPPALPTAPNTSGPWVPLTVIPSAAPSPPPSGPRRSRRFEVTSVPLRSPTTMLSAPPRARKSMLSTSSRSIVTLATLRKNRTRPPLAETSMFSPMLAPKNSIVSTPSWPSRVSLPSPGFHWNESSPAPIRARSLPLSPNTTSLPLPPRNTSAPCEPRSESSPAPPSVVSLITPAGSVVAVTASSPSSALTTSESFAPSELLTFTRAARPSTDADVPAPTMSMTSLPLVPLTTIRSACPSPAAPPSVPARSLLISTTSVPDRSLTVNVSTLPSALRSMTSTSLPSMTMLPRLRVKSSRPPFADAWKISLAALPLNSIVSVPSWPSIVSFPSPGSHWKTSLPTPREATSLPCWPSTKSSPSPLRSTSLPLLPRIVSSPVPPSTLIAISAARLPVAEKLSLPPLAFRTSFSEVPMSIENGAGSSRSNRTRVPFAVVVKTSAPLPPFTSTVSVPAPPSFRSVSSPGFQIIRSLPLSPNAWSSPSPPVRVSFSLPPKRKSNPPLPSRVSFPACPNS